MRRINNFIIIILLVNCIVNQAFSSEKDNNIKLNDYYIKTEKIENIYNRQYSFWNNQIDYDYLGKSAFIVLGASVAAVGILYLMPESFTNWDKGDISPKNLFGDWWDNVKEGPIKDKDDFFLNYVTHPYWGAVYYMSARSAGVNAPYSFLFSVIVSTFFWEYGVEAFAEVPSIQDIFITPIIGSIIGEGFYLSKRHILSNEYKLFNSKILGHITLFLMDPITEITNLFIKDYETKKDLTITSFPSVTRDGYLSYNIMLNLKF